MFADLERIYDGGSTDHRYTVHQDYIVHIIHDDYISDHIIIIWGNAVLSIALNDSSTKLIAGRIELSGYQEGEGDAARFNGISGVITSPLLYPNYLLVTDVANYCIRSIDRREMTTATVAGKCQLPGNTDGYVKNARFGLITAIEQHPSNPYSIFLYDQSVHILKVLTIGNCMFKESNVASVARIASSKISGGTNLLDMVYDLDGDKLYLSYTTSIMSYKISSSAFRTVVSESAPNVNHLRDPSFVEAEISFPTNVVFLSTNYFIFGDLRQATIKIVNSNENSITSLCENSLSNLCFRIYPNSILKDRYENKLYIASEISLYEIAYVGEIYKHYNQGWTQAFDLSVPR